MARVRLGRLSGGRSIVSFRCQRCCQQNSSRWSGWFGGSVWWLCSGLRRLFCRPWRRECGCICSLRCCRNTLCSAGSLWSGFGILVSQTCIKSSWRRRVSWSSQCEVCRQVCSRGKHGMANCGWKQAVILRSPSSWPSWCLAPIVQQRLYRNTTDNFQVQHCLKASPSNWPAHWDWSPQS